MTTQLNSRANKMPADLHKGITLDDKFAKLEVRLQKVLQDFEMLHDDFRDDDHRPVESQLSRLTYSVGRAKTLLEDFRVLRNKK